MSSDPTRIGPEAGLATARPVLPPGVFCAQDYERLAEERLSPAVFAHTAGGSGDEAALARNRSAFEAAVTTPRMLVDFDGANTQVRASRLDLPHPILLAPLAHQGLYHPKGELETAQGAAVVGAGLVCSTLSSNTLEDIASACGPARWFQLYLQPDWAVSLDLVRRAEAAGYQGLVLTVDAPVQTPSLRALRAGFTGEGSIAANLAAYPAPPPPPLASGESRVFGGPMRQAPRLRDIARLKAETGLPLWIKGVLHPEDARQFLAAGADGLIVSNHGGRAFDGAPAALSALPAVRQAVGDAVPVLMDGGVRSGRDVFAAIAHGADAVLIGRLQAYALAVAGALGVAHMIRLLREELELNMALAGCPDLAAIRRLGAAS